MQVYKVSLLEKKRRDQGLSQWEVAKQADIVQSRLSLLERGKVIPRPIELEKLTRVLKLSENELRKIQASSND